MHSTLKIVLFLIFSIVLSGCKINQKKKSEKTGRWIYKDNVVDEVIISKGRYKHDFEIGTWKEYSNQKLISKKRYRKRICYTTDYHSNGKVKAKGVSKLEIESTTAHWFLDKEWRFYDDNGTYLGATTYEKGTPISTTLDTIN